MSNRTDDNNDNIGKTILCVGAVAVGGAVLGIPIFGWVPLLAVSTGLAIGAAAANHFCDSDSED